MRSAGVRTAVLASMATAIIASCKRGPEPGKIDCDTEIQYQGRVVEGEVKVSKFGAEAKTSIEAVRQIDQVVERYLARWQGMCREYNAGVYSKDEYRIESRALREKMEQLDGMLMQLANAPDSAAYQAALTAMYQKIVPSEERTTLSLSLRVLAQRPGESAPALVSDGARLPTGSKLSFEITPSQAAHVYLYQESPSGEVVVLFPDPRIAQNPLPGGAALRLPPPPASFRLNAEDVGTETVHIVAAREALPQLASTLAGEGVTAAAAGCSSRGLEYDAGAAPCESGARGLTYDDGGGASLSAVSELGGDRIIQRFTFEHTP